MELILDIFLLIVIAYLLLFCMTTLPILIMEFFDRLTEQKEEPDLNARKQAQEPLE